MAGGRVFNIHDKSGRLLCPACGLPGYFGLPAYDERGGIIGMGICPCCFWEPGFDDDIGASVSAKPTILESLRAYRASWAVSFSWQGKDCLRPADWDGKAQLKALLELAPHLC
jgi:hypothetical protein